MSTITLTQANRTAIADYVKTCTAKSLSPERILKLTAHAEERIQDIVLEWLKSAKQNIWKGDHAVMASATVEPAFLGPKKLRDIFDSILKNNLEMQIEYRAISEYASEDMVLKEVGEAPRTRHNYRLAWFLDNPYVGTPSVSKVAAPTQAAHFRKEWEACKEGRGTDLAIQFEGSSEAPLQVHLAKLVMHSSYFESLTAKNFADGQELAGKKCLKIAQQDCSREIFLYLLECIYTGQIAQQMLAPAQLTRLLIAADFYQIATAKEWVVFQIHRALLQQQGTAELPAMLKHGATTNDKGLIALCYMHLKGQLEEALIRVVTRENWETLHTAAAEFPDARTILLNCKKYNPELQAAESSAQAAASPSSASASSSASDSKDVRNAPAPLE